ncbi:MAG: TatD family hydrolase [Rhodothermaceae bacterium]
MFIDTHAHLFYKNFNGELDQIVERAIEANVKYMVCPGTDVKTSKQSIEIAEKYQSVYATVGIHPHDTKGFTGKEISELRKLADHKKVVAIGEIGLDYYYDFSPKNQQIKAFKAQLDLAAELDLPVVIHNREANEDTMNILREYKSKNLKGQLHCYAGTIEDAEELIEMGFLISFTGNITFKKLEELREILKTIPVENLMLETDCPFMTPVPFRGKRNEPSYIPYIAEKVAEIHNVSVEEVEQLTTFNALNLFGIGNEME